MKRKPSVPASAAVVPAFGSGTTRVTVFPASDVSKPLKFPDTDSPLLRSLTLANARSFEHASLVFHPGVNVIVGPSDSGKSNLVRSIVAVLENEPASSFVSAWAESGFATLSACNGSSVRLDKSESVNGYTVRSRSNLGVRAVSEKYSSVGLGAPDAVREVLRLSPVDIAGEPVWLSVSSQRGPAFGVDDSPARLARVVGSVSGLGAVFSAQARAGTDARDARAVVPALVEAVKAASDSVAAAEAGGDPAALRAAAARAEAACDCADSASFRASSLRAGVDSVTRLSASLSACRAALPSLSASLELARASVASAEAAFGSASRLREALSRVLSASGALSSVRAEAEAAAASLSAARSALAAAWASVSVCPLCESPVKEAACAH